MKLLHIIGSMDPVSGGPCQGIRNSNPAMRRLGVYREVVSLDDPSAAFLGSDDFPIHALGPAQGLWQYSEKLLPWLTANIERFDVLVINGLWIYSSYAGWKAMRTVNKRNKGKNIKMPRLFVMPHGMLDPYFQRAAERRLKANRNWIYWNLIEKKVVNDADGLLFTSQTELLLARETFKGYQPKNEYNVGYGIIAPPKYSPIMKKAFVEKCPDIGENSYLLFFSRIHQKKGIDLLIAAYSELIDKANALGKTIPKLVIAGPGVNTAFGRKVFRMAATARFKNMFFFPGMLTGNAKWGALYGCEAFILPSHQENFGIAVVEALSCSKPVLISDQVNIWREIKTGNGGLIASDTTEATAKMLEEWLSLSEDDKNSMSKNAFNVYKHNFDIEYSSNIFFNAISSE
jgi:glycosyltransferase involved in cell wall biosynthesis